MEKSGQIGLARVIMGTRERILALKPLDRGILAYTIRTDAEVRNPTRSSLASVTRRPFRT